MSEPPRPSSGSGAPEPGSTGRDDRSADPGFDEEPALDPDPAAEDGAVIVPPARDAGGTGNSADGADSTGDAASAAHGDDEASTRERRQGKRAPWWELPALIVLAVLIAVVVKTFVVQPFYIPSASMEHTLHGAPDGGDRILVNKLIYDFRDPHPGDIVVFDAPPGWNEITTSPPSNPILHGIHWFGQLVGFVPPDGEVLVKRVIATGGETVWGDTDGRVHVRTAAGHVKVLDESYVYESGPDTRQTFGPVTVPKGRLWVMGDHRSDSQDSRYHCGTDGGDDAEFGHSCDPTGSTVPVDNVVGKAFVVAWPPSHWRTLGTPPTFEGLAAAADRIVPTASGGLVLLPLWFARRRRRRR